MSILISWIVSTLVIISITYILPGVHIQNFTSAFVAALVLGVINAFLKPVLLLLTLPINLLTLGLFTLVINALLVMLATYIVPGFSVDSFWWALAFSIVMSIVNFFLDRFSL